MAHESKIENLWNELHAPGAYITCVFFDFEYLRTSHNDRQAIIDLLERLAAKQHTESQGHIFKFNN